MGTKPDLDEASSNNPDNNDFPPSYLSTLNSSKLPNDSSLKNVSKIITPYTTQHELSTSLPVDTSNKEVSSKDRIQTIITSSWSATTDTSEIKSVSQILENEFESMDILDNVKAQDPSTFMYTDSNMEENLPNDVSSTSEKATVPKKVFNQDELYQALIPTLESFFKQDSASGAAQKNMGAKLIQDLNNIKDNLNNGKYEDPWQYIEDIWYIFNGVWKNYGRKRKTNRCCKMLAEVFKQEIDPVMQLLGYCCGQKEVFHSQCLNCYAHQCVIPWGSKYWSYKEYIYCVKCFELVIDDLVKVEKNPSKFVEKSLFLQKKNHIIHLEPFVRCCECGRDFHQICVMHIDEIWPNGFVCTYCLNKKYITRKENQFTAKGLPETKLSAFIQNRVNGLLRDKDVEVTIRVVSCVRKVAEVQPEMKKIFVNNDVYT